MIIYIYILFHNELTVLVYSISEDCKATFLNQQSEEPLQMPSHFLHIGQHNKSVESESGPTETLPHGELVKVFCKLDGDYLLACHNDTLVMATANNLDESQQWIKDVSFGEHVKDIYGYPAFALVNKGHKKVLKHAKEEDQDQKVIVADYMPGMPDDSILWTQSQDFGDGFRTIRIASDTLINITVYHGDRRLHGLKNGSPLILDTWHKQDHQLWKILPL